MEETLEPEIERRQVPRVLTVGISLVSRNETVRGWLVRQRRRFLDVASGRRARRRVSSELTQLRSSVDDLRKAVDHLQRSAPTLKEIQQEHGRLEANVQAEFQLRDMIASDGRAATITPLNPRWQLSSQAMQQVVQQVLSHRPGLVVECGSGASTMWIARALRQLGEGRVISLEDSADWVAIVTRLLEQEGLERAEVRHAPIKPLRVAGREQPWYSLSALVDIEQIDLLLVDGPPGRTSELARYPALGVLRDKLGPGAVIMLDDCHRRDEKETLRKWLAEDPRLSLVRQIDRLAVIEVRGERN